MEKQWIYIRAMFEKEYMKYENSFECVRNDVERGYANCICIPGAAVNYIVNEMKFLLRVPGKTLTWAFDWETKYNYYFVKKDSSDWNLGISDLNEQKSNNDFDVTVQFCEDSPNEFTYIKIQNVNEMNFEEVISSNIFATFGGVSNEAELELFTILARDYRTEKDIHDYTKMLFRLSFFLHPYQGVKEIEKAIKNNIDNREMLEFNIELLNDYLKLGNSLEQLEEVYLRDILRVIGEFVGVNLLIVYTFYKNSEEYGDIQKTNELIKRKRNDTIKMINKKDDSRIRRLLKKCSQ